MYKEENLITKLNYSPRIRALLFMAVFSTAGVIGSYIEQGALRSQLPAFARGHTNDFFGGLFFSAETFLIDKNATTKSSVACGILGPSLVELSQATGIWGKNGTFDWWDFPAYVLGAITWGIYDKSAKALYDSKITMPIYEMLGIQDRRLTVDY